MSELDMEEVHLPNDKKPVDTEDKNQLKSKKLRISRIRNREIDEMRLALKTPGVRNIFWRLLREAQIYETSFAGERPLTMSFNEGKKHVGRWLLGELLTADPGAYIQMQAEKKAENENEDYDA